MLALLTWGAAWICFEDHWEDLELKPTLLSAFLGTFVITWAFWRTSLVSGYDGILYITPTAALIGLTCLLGPVRRIRLYRDIFAIFALFPAWILLVKFFPEKVLSFATSYASGFLLKLLGLDPSIDGRIISFTGGMAVRVEGACNGLEVIYQAFAVAVIFLICFPLRRRSDRLTLLIFAPLIGAFSNIVRVALLGFIVAIGGTIKESSFEFWHEGTGSLIFSGASIMLVGFFYSRLIQRQLNANP